MLFQLRLWVEAQTDLPKKAGMRETRMHDGGIDRYHAISTSACVRNGRMHRTRPRPERRLACRAGESGAAPSARLPPRPDAERYVHTVRDLTFPIGDVAVGIGSHSLARESPKGRFSPQEAPSAAAARCSPEVEIAIRCRAARPRPSRTPCEVGLTTARHQRCPFPPAGQGVETCRSAL